MEQGQRAAPEKLQPQRVYAAMRLHLSQENKEEKKS